MKKVILILLVLLTIGLNYNWQPIQMDDYAASQLMAEIKGAVVQPAVMKSLKRQRFLI